MNELLWVIYLLLDLSLVIIIYKLFGKPGLYSMIVLNTVIANLQVMKNIELFGLVTTLGNIVYGSIFLCSDILCEKFGKKEAKKAVWLGFAALLITLVYMQVALLFTPHSSDFIHSHLKAIFDFYPRVALGSLIAYFLSQNLDIHLFNVIKRLTAGKKLWLRNTLSTVTSQLFDTLIFCMIAFLGVYGWDIWLQIFLTTYLFKFVVAIVDTPFFYIADRLKTSG